MTDGDVDGYKKFHVEIDMNNFQTWDGSADANVDYPFAVTPSFVCIFGKVYRSHQEFLIANCLVFKFAFTGILITL